MPSNTEDVFDVSDFLNQSEDHDLDLHELPGWMFRGLTIYLDKLSPADRPSQNGDGGPVRSFTSDMELDLAGQVVRLAGGTVQEDLDDSNITHIVVGDDRSKVRRIRQTLSYRNRIPHVVTVQWVEESWKERTLLDEERE